MMRSRLLLLVLVAAVVAAFALPVVAQAGDPGAPQNPWQALMNVLVPLMVLWATNGLNWLEKRKGEIPNEAKQATAVVLGILASWAGLMHVPNDIYGPVLSHVGPSLTGALAAGMSTLAYDLWQILIALKNRLQSPPVPVPTPAPT